MKGISATDTTTVNSGGKKHGFSRLGYAKGLLAALVWLALAQQWLFPSTALATNHNPDAAVAEHIDESGNVRTWKGHNKELRAISLKQLCLHIRESEANKGRSAYSEDLCHLAGISEFCAYRYDQQMDDVILIGWFYPEQEPLRLDDLASLVTGTLLWQESISCSLDPIPEALKQLEIFSDRYNLPDMRNRARLIEWVNAARVILGDQIVVVRGVRRHSRIAHTMIDADYHMKKVSQGLVRLQSVPSVLDIRASRAKAGDTGTGEGLCRFFFELDKEQPEIVYSDFCAWLKSCRVVISARRQIVGGDGELCDAESEDPDATHFAGTFSTKLPEIAGDLPVYARLMNIYRLNAIIKAIAYRSHHRGYLTVFWRDYSSQDEQGMPLALSAQGNATLVKTEHTDQLLSVLGGVDLGVRIGKSNFKEPSKDQKADIKAVESSILKDRPNPASIWWSVKVGEKGVDSLSKRNISSCAELDPIQCRDRAYVGNIAESVSSVSSLSWTKDSEWVFSRSGRIHRLVLPDGEHAR